MSCSCGNPNCQGVATREHIGAKIKQYGQFIVAVFGDGDYPPFAYTIGRHGRGLPELLLIMEDDDHAAAGALLNFLGPRDVRSGQTVASGDRVYAVTDGSGDPELIREMVTQADDYYGCPVPALALLFHHRLTHEPVITKPSFTVIDGGRS